jgi:hypothetical protein
VVILIVVVVVMLLMSRCGSEEACSDERATFGEASTEYQQCLARQQRSGGFSRHGRRLVRRLFNRRGGHK